MKDRLVFFSVVICIFFVVFLFHPAITLSAPRPQVIKIVMDNNYPPYVFPDSNGKLQGILIDQWKLWEQKTGIRTEISAMDWDEALRRMKAGEFDVIDTIFKTEERSRLARLYRGLRPIWKSPLSSTKRSPAFPTRRP